MNQGSYSPATTVLSHTDTVKFGYPLRWTPSPNTLVFLSLRKAKSRNVFM